MIDTLQAHPARETIQAITMVAGDIVDGRVASDLANLIKDKIAMVRAW